MMRARSRLDETPVFFPHPLAVEVVRRFPGHWQFGLKWWLREDSVLLPLGAGSLRVFWPRLDHRDAHSWRAEFHSGSPYNLRRFDDLGELPGAAASAIIAYAQRGADWSGRCCPDRAAARKILLANQPPWLQVEIDRLTAPKLDRAEGLHP